MKNFCALRGRGIWIEMLLLLAALQPQARGAETPVTGEIIGTLLDDHGKPIAGVEIEMRGARPGDRRQEAIVLGGVETWMVMERDALGSARSAEDGTIYIENLPLEQMLIFSVRTPNYYPAEMRGIRLTTETASLTRAFTLRQGGGIKGRVLDSAGNPVAGARVQVWGHDAQMNFKRDKLQELSRDDGSFEFPGVPPAKCSIAVEADGHGGLERRDLNIVRGSTLDLGDLKLTRGARLIGRVLSKTAAGDRPEAGVRTHVTFSSRIQPTAQHPDLAYSSARQTTTSATGTFSVDSLTSPGTYNVWLRKGQRSSAEEQQLTLPPPDGVTTQTVWISPEGAITARVTDQTSQPIAGVRVTAASWQRPGGNKEEFSNRNWRDAQQPVPFGLSRKDGVLHLPGLAAEAAYELICEAPGYSTLRTDPIAATSDTTHTIVLQPYARLAGRVTIGNTSDTVIGAHVWVSVEGAGERKPPVWTTTDDQGRFEFNQLSAGQCVLSAVPSDEDEGLFVVIPQGRLELRAGKLTEADLQTVPPATVRGRVTIGGDETKPLEGAEVSVRQGISIEDKTPGARPLGNVVRDLTDSEGNFEIHGVVPGRLDIEAKKPGYVLNYQPIATRYRGTFERKPIDQSTIRADAKAYQDRLPKVHTVEPGGTAEGIALTLYPADADPGNQMVTVAGAILTPDKKPAAGVEVSTFRDYMLMAMEGFGPPVSFGPAVQTDQYGRYSFRALRKEILGVVVHPTAERPWYGVQNGADPFTTWTLLACCSITGRVEQPNGESVAEARVSIQSNANFPTWYKSAVTDAGGVFKFELLPAGWHTVSASKAGMRSLKDEWEEGREVAPGQAMNDIKLVLIPQNLHTARLVDRQKNPLANWQVLGDKTAGDGSFTYELLNEMRSLSFSNSHASYHTAPLESGAPEPPENIEFVIPAWGTVKGRLVQRGDRKPYRDHQLRLACNDDPLPPPLSFYDVVLSRYDAALDPIPADGRFEFKEVPAATFDLQLRSRSDTLPLRKGLRLQPGETLDLGDIEVVSPITLTGRAIRAADGGPINGWEYRIRAEGLTADQMSVRPKDSGMDLNGRFRLVDIPGVARSIRLSIVGRKGLNRDNQRDTLYAAVLPLGELEPDQTHDLGSIAFHAYRIVMRIEDPAGSQAWSPEQINRMILSYPPDIQPGTEWYGPEVFDLLGEGLTQAQGILPGFSGCLLNVRERIPAVIDRIPPPDASGTIDLGTIVLQGGHAVRGTASRPDGSPIVSAKIIIEQGASSQETQTDAQGNYSVSGLSAGPAMLTVTIGTEMIQYLKQNAPITIPPTGDLMLPLVLGK